MTHLGIVSAVATAARGFPVIGYDPDGQLIERLCRGEMPVVEPELDALAQAQADRLSFSADATELRRCDVVYIATDVPTDDNANSDLAPIRALIDRVSRELND